MTLPARLDLTRFLADAGAAEDMQALRALLGPGGRPAFYGKHAGVVTDTNDPKGIGRLRARVPEVFGEEEPCGWALPCLPWGGGKNRGFFALPEAGSFLLAGGLALVAHGLTDRPTEDLDVFTSKAEDVAVAAEAFTRAAADREWMVETVQESETFVRLSVALCVKMTSSSTSASTLHRICRLRC